MEVILRQAVENLGKPGDVVKVSNGYARNFLLPRGVAFEATAGNLKRIAQEKSRLEAAENERRSAAQELAARLEQGAVSAYLGAVPLFQNRDLSKAAASILGDEAMHWAILRQALGEVTVPSEFVA